MKNKINLRIGLIGLLLCTCLSCSKDRSENPPLEESISFYSTPEVYDLTKQWAGVFSKLISDVPINVVNASGSDIIENLENNRNVSFVSGDFDSVVYARTLWKVVVGRDVIVPVIHSENPLTDEIYRQGVSPAGFSRIINNSGTIEWGNLLGTGHMAPVHLYITETAALHPGWSEFLGTDQVTIKGIHVADAKELIAAVRGDKYSMGVCNLTDVIAVNSHQIREDVKLLPIDKNGNGLIDYKEDIYADLNTFSRGVWIGKYPRALSSNIYSISASNPTHKTEIAFLKWIITNGQVLLDNHGFSHLESGERIAQVKWIDSFNVGVPGSEKAAIWTESGLLSRLFPLILAIILIGVLLEIIWIHLLDKRRASVPVHAKPPGLAFNEDVIKSLPGLYYDKSHTWAFMDEEGLVKVGIDDFIQHVTGPLTRIKMKSPGERIRKGRLAVSIIQDGKQLDLCAPVSGIIREHNEILNTNTSIINSSPCSEGWIYKIEPTQWLQEVQFLIMGKTYREWLKAEFQRLKEFLMDSIRPGGIEYANVLQDGGELKDSILKEFGPEAWEDFQTNFIDLSA